MYKHQCQSEINGAIILAGIGVYIFCSQAWMCIQILHITRFSGTPAQRLRFLKKNCSMQFVERNVFEECADVKHYTLLPFATRLCLFSA